MPFSIDEWMRITFSGSVFGLLNPFGLLCGLVALSMVAMHGSAFLLVRTKSNINARAHVTLKIAAVVTTLLFLLAGAMVVTGIDGYVLTSVIDHSAPSDPLSKTVQQVSGAWLNNFNHHPALWLLPLMGTLMPLSAVLCASAQRNLLTFIASALSVCGIISTVAVAMFPFVMPSSLAPNVSLTLWDSTSSQLTLQLMTVVAVVMIPTILAYTNWCYYKMFTRFDEKTIEDNSHSLY